MSPISTEQVGVFNVTFEPTVRNNWHVHHGGGQILLATHGRGWYQEWGKPAVELKPGDKVNIAPGTKHWHGAARDSWFTHIAIEVPSENIEIIKQGCQVAPFFNSVFQIYFCRIILHRSVYLNRMLLSSYLVFDCTTDHDRKQCCF